MPSDNIQKHIITSEIYHSVKLILIGLTFKLCGEKKHYWEIRLL